MGLNSPSLNIHANAFIPVGSILPPPPPPPPLFSLAPSCSIRLKTPAGQEVSAHTLAKRFNLGPPKTRTRTKRKNPASFRPTERDRADLSAAVPIVVPPPRARSRKKVKNADDDLAQSLVSARCESTTFVQKTGTGSGSPPYTALEHETMKPVSPDPGIRSVSAEEVPRIYNTTTPEFVLNSDPQAPLLPAFDLKEILEADRQFLLFLAREEAKSARCTTSLQLNEGHPTQPPNDPSTPEPLSLPQSPYHPISSPVIRYERDFLLQFRFTSTVKPRFLIPLKEYGLDPHRPNYTKPMWSMVGSATSKERMTRREAPQNDSTASNNTKETSNLSRRVEGNGVCESRAGSAAKIFAQLSLGCKWAADALDDGY